MASAYKNYQTIEGRCTVLLRCMRTSSKVRGQECTITREQLIAKWNRQQGLCAYSGQPMTLEPAVKRGGKLTRWDGISVERMDCSVGYTDDNTVFVCYGINRMRSDLPMDVFLKLCAAVTNKS